MKKGPLRLCIGTRIMHPQHEMIRIVNFKGVVMVDLDQCLEGRGAYVSKDKSALENVKKKNLLARALKREIPRCVYEELERLVS